MFYNPGAHQADRGVAAYSAPVWPLGRHQQALLNEGQDRLQLGGRVREALATPLGVDLKHRWGQGGGVGGC